MLLYLLRHGDALTDSALPDSERPLSELGFRQATAAAQFLKRSGASVNLIITSPLLRARQMAVPTKELFGVTETQTSECLTPFSDQRQLFSLLNATTAESILLVGHEPHLSSTIALLISGETQSRAEMKKGSCACVETKRPVDRGSGILRWLATTELMPHQ